MTGPLHPGTVEAGAWQALTCPTRLPDLGPHGLAMLRRLYEHPAAPHYRDFSGHRLTAELRWRARLRQPWLRHGPVAYGMPPAWIWPWLFALRHEVRDWPATHTLARGWQAIRTTSRADLASRLADLVPRSRQTTQLLCFRTSGATGHPIRIPTEPLAAAAYQALHERALRLHGLRLRAGRGDVGVVLAGFQQRCFSYVSVNPLRGECGLAKLNLHPSEWRHAADRAIYLDAMRPEILSGDPVSLGELATLAMQHRPLALLSTSMALSKGLRLRLAARFGCAVLDIYSMNEAGPVAVWVDAVSAFVLLQPGLYVEILDADGRAVPPGQHGEIALSGGINACLPLLRYRTGDHAQLVMTPLGPALRNLQGRPPVRLRHHAGHWINNIDVSQHLGRFDLCRFALHQHADGALTLRIDGAGVARGTQAADLRACLGRLLGPLPLAIERLQTDDKQRQYTSDVPGACP